MASKTERDIIDTVSCPTCGRPAGKGCVTVRSGAGKYGAPNNQPTSVHPRRKQVWTKQVKGDQHDTQTNATT